MVEGKYYYLKGRDIGIISYSGGAFSHVPAGSTVKIVTKSYPKEIESLADEVTFEKSDLLTAGVLMRFYESKKMYNDAMYWESRFIRLLDKYKRVNTVKTNDSTLMVYPI